jgi:Baseplate J-like protein
MSATAPTIDRRLLVLASDTLNGIDFVEVASDQVQLAVHFLNAVSLKGTLGVPPVTITGGEVVTSVAVLPIDEGTSWSADSRGRPVLSLAVPAPGDFSTYTLTVFSSKLDPFFDHGEFNFRTDPSSTLDCATAPPAAPAPASDAQSVPIDYLAKDFGSFRQALSEFSTLRYPGWVERSEADLGVVLMEALAALGDELSYYQDRVLGESTIETATQRLSVVRHARLVDYEPTPATVATTVLQLNVNPASSPPRTGWTIDTPLRCNALGADGSIIEFEVEDPTAGLSGSLGTNPPSWASVDTRWNRGSLVPYYWDDSMRSLEAGSSDFYMRGSSLGLYEGQQLLLDSPGPTSADPPVRELVAVAGWVETSDVLRGGIALTQVSLAAPTTAAHDLGTTAVAGNVVPAVQGVRQSETFTIPDPTAASTGPVVVRVGADSGGGDLLPDYRYCLLSGPLAWLAKGAQEEYSATPVQPEIVLSQLPPAGDAVDSPVAWQFVRWLLEAGPADRAFTLTPEQYSVVLSSGTTTWLDYDGDGGTTIRFGDGSFGTAPLPGTSFEVLYRVGGGADGNVPADTIVSVAAGQAQGSLVAACTNPFAATGGADAETIGQVRSRAPQRFHTGQLRLVQPGDYEAAARSLPWVQEAGTTFRWTGSWLTAVTTVDPGVSEQPSAAQLQSLTTLLDGRRLAGYESYVLAPRYLSLDLEIVVVGMASAFTSDVEQAVLTRLAPGILPDGSAGFFDHSRWGFGQPLESSALLAAVQGCVGVQGVSALHYRRRGIDASFLPLTETLPVASDQILRIDNDPNRPEAGSLQVTVTGSK